MKRISFEMTFKLVQNDTRQSYCVCVLLEALSDIAFGGRCLLVAGAAAVGRSGEGGSFVLSAREISGPVLAEKLSPR